MVKLIAKVNVKHGGLGETTAPGEAFEIDEAGAAALIASGSAATPEDYERDRLANESAGEKIAELEAENARLRAAANTPAR